MDYVEPSQNQISLKMIPRIDFKRIEARESVVCWLSLSPLIKGDILPYQASPGLWSAPRLSQAHLPDQPGGSLF